MASMRSPRCRHSGPASSGPFGCDPGRRASGSGCDVFPEFVERDAVVERCAVDDLAVAERHEPGVGILVSGARDGAALAVLQHDDGAVVLVVVDGPDVDRAERVV
jgi:hypothetical protein